MAASDLPLVLEAVGDLDLELSRLVGQASSLLGPSSNADRATTSIALRETVERTHRAMHAVRERVLESASPLTLLRFESAFRARGVVAQLQLHELALAEPISANPIWPCGRFRSLSDVSSYVLDRLGRVNAAWVGSRRDLAGDDDDADHRRLIAEVAQAERDLVAIGRDVDLISFLAVGASIAAPRFRLACRVIAALLDIPLAPLKPAVARRSALARRLAPHAVTFTPVQSEEDEQ